MWPSFARSTPTTLQFWEGSLNRSSERLWSAFMTARVAVASVLVLLQGAVLMLGGTTNGLSLLLCTAHLVTTVAARRLVHPRTTLGVWRWPWLPTVGVDWGVYAVLQTLQPGGLNYSLLFALPVLMAATLGPLRRALGAAASVTLYLLIDAAWRAWSQNDDGTARYLQTAITGTGYFLIALLAHQLSVRLAREEALAETSQSAARTQAEVNALIIETLSDGVLVVDKHLQVWAANPAARALLGDAAGPTPEHFWLTDRAYCAPLNELIQHTLTAHQPQTAEIQLATHNDHRQRLSVRTRPMGSAPEHTPVDGPSCVVFLQDLHEIEARIRAEKLAGMGRMTVAVAHEIRNPLSAISQANELLTEELQDPMQRRLVQMIGQNTQRLNRIVDDILNVVRIPGRPALQETAPLPLDAALANTLTEWCGQHACTTRVRCTPRCPEVQVRFDAEHFRRVLINLLDNAHRYASMAPGAIQIDTQVQAPDAVCLSVWSDGAPLEPGIRRHLFEPFFSSESRSSGMGLYLCRELCDRYQARLDYRRADRDGRSGNEFFVVMAAAHPPSP
jgi:two-component system sensor histidine kinase PilS (NtrC family)